MGTCVPAFCTWIHKTFPSVQNVPGVWNVLHCNAGERFMYPGTKRRNTCTRKTQCWQEHGNKSWGGGTRVSLGKGLYDLIYPPWHSSQDVSISSTLPVRVRPIVPLQATLFSSLATHWAFVLLRVKGYGSGYCSMFIVIATKALHMEWHPAHTAVLVGLAAAPFGPHPCPSALHRHVHHIRRRPLHLRNLTFNDGPLELGHCHVRIPHTKFPAAYRITMARTAALQLRIRLDSRNCKASWLHRSTPLLFCRYAVTTLGNWSPRPSVTHQASMSQFVKNGTTRRALLPTLGALKAYSEHLARLLCPTPYVPSGNCAPA